MKKKSELIKTIQLILFLCITCAGLVAVFKDDELYQMIGSNVSVRMISMLLWLTLGLSFIFILIDFRISASMKKDYKELDYALRNDRVAGIANRYSCDAMIDKYVDAELPDNIGCVMLEISNIREINETYGHTRGNAAIQEFANILLTASVGLCFVGRNGGNKFMALFEDCTAERMNSFLVRVNSKIEVHNRQNGTAPLEYRTGSSFSAEDKVPGITRLISLADQRLSERRDAATGLINRAGCDELIELYIDKPLPETIGCIMLEITNIRDINEEHGHSEGNRCIRLFADALREASYGLCLVGRNGGCKFLALFEECTDEKLDLFEKRVGDDLITRIGENNAPAIRYAIGRAFHEGPEISTINRLIALSDRRLVNQRLEAQGK